MGEWGEISVGVAKVKKALGFRRCPSSSPLLWNFTWSSLVFVKTQLKIPFKRQVSVFVIYVVPHPQHHFASITDTKKMERLRISLGLKVCLSSNRRSTRQRKGIISRQTTRKYLDKLSISNVMNSTNSQGTTGVPNPHYSLQLCPWIKNIYIYIEDTSEKLIWPTNFMY